MAIFNLTLSQRRYGRPLELAFRPKDDEPFDQFLAALCSRDFIDGDEVVARRDAGKSQLRFYPVIVSTAHIVSACYWVDQTAYEDEPRRPTRIVHRSVEPFKIEEDEDAPVRGHGLEQAIAKTNADIARAFDRGADRSGAPL